MIDVEWRGDDMRKGLKIIHRDPSPIPSLITAELKLDWEDVDSLISLCIAYRELKSSKERVGIFSAHVNDEVNGGGEDEIISYGGTA